MWTLGSCNSCGVQRDHHGLRRLRQGGAIACSILVGVSVGVTSHAAAEPQEAVAVTCLTALDDGGLFGTSVTYLGDVDNDGSGDLAVGAYKDPTAGTEYGSVWIIFLNQTGTIKSRREITQGINGFTGMLSSHSHFGISVAALGDLDNDGVEDLAVGENGSDRGGIDQGAVWILFLNSNGTVKSHQLISEVDGGFTGTLDTSDLFAAVGTVGDLDNDNVVDLAVGAVQDDDGGVDRGAVWILFLNTNGTVKAHQKISDTVGGFTGTLDDYDFFGAASTGIGDLDDDGVLDLAVGASLDDDGNEDAGAVWILFLNANGTVKGHQKISSTDGNFFGSLRYHDNFGISLSSTDDLDSDGNRELVVGARGDDDGGPDRGAAWFVYLQDDGMAKGVAGHHKINDWYGEFTGWLDDFDYFGRGVAWMGDHNGDGHGDVVVGSYTDDDGGPNRGAVWELFLDTNQDVSLFNKISDSYMAFSNTVVDHDTIYGVLNHRRVDVYNNKIFALNPVFTTTCPEYTVFDAPYTLEPNEHSYVLTQFEPTVWGAFPCSLLTGAGCPPIDVVGYSMSGVGERPPSFALRQNYPNPFSPLTLIEYSLDREYDVVLAVYDVTGRKVRTLVDQRKRPNVYRVQWDGLDDRKQTLADGVYFLRLTAGSRVLTRKAVLLR